MAVNDAAFAERASAWLPDLVSLGFGRVTLFHAIGDDGPAVAEDLDRLRPLLDRLAVTLSAHGVETEIALKRGDAIKWLTALAALRQSDVIVAGAREGPAGATSAYLEPLLAQSPVPVLVLPLERAATAPGLAARPVLLSGEYDVEVEQASRDLVPAALATARLGPEGALPQGASLLVTGPAPSGGSLVEVLDAATCPVLLFPSRTLGAPARAN